MIIHQILRGFSIIAYMCIFIQGEIISGPMLLLMLGAIVNSDLVTQVVVGFAFLALLSLMALMAFPKKIWTLLLETIIFVLLWLPMLRELMLDQSDLLNYPLFIVPAACFTLLYLLSLIYSYRIYIRQVEEFEPKS